MSSDFTQEHARLLARLNEKADQYSEEADGIHDDVRKLQQQVSTNGQQVSIIAEAAKLIEKQIASAREIDTKSQALAQAAAESARQSAAKETLASLNKMLDNISAVTDEAREVCQSAGRRMLLANAWGIICIVTGILGFGGGAALMHRLDRDQFVTADQLRRIQLGDDYSVIWNHASPRERELLEKIAARQAAPR